MRDQPLSNLASAGSVKQNSTSRLSQKGYLASTPAAAALLSNTSSAYGCSGAATALRCCSLSTRKDVIASIAARHRALTPVRAIKSGFIKRSAPGLLLESAEYRNRRIALCCTRRNGRSTRLLG